jgi:hypothetical protein
LHACAKFDPDFYSTNFLSVLSPLIPGEQVRIDPSAPIYNAFPQGSLTFPSMFEARVYFTHDGASGCSLLGFTTDGSGSPAGTGGTVFPDASEGPLQLGNYVDLGTFPAFTPLDFFLRVDANHCVGPELGVVSTQASANSDGVADHVVELFSMSANGNGYWAYGFEDFPGLGDADFNDVVFTVELTPVPEPSILALAACALGGFLIAHRVRPGAMEWRCSQRPGRQGGH